MVASQITLQNLLECPRCRAGLTEHNATWSCKSCNTIYPSLDGIPWLFPEPQATLAEWQVRLQILLQQLDDEKESLKAELNNSTLRELTSKRLRKLLQAKAEQRKALEELLAPLALSDKGTLAISRAMQVQIPVTQSLTSYYPNIHRDWAWDTEENAACLAAVDAVLGNNSDLGHFLVLGAGACRLTYDLHLKYKPKCTIATDINPLMFLAAKRLLKGKKVRLYEFPIAPIDLDSGMILRKCEAPETPVHDLNLVFMDALHPACQMEKFDTVFTPWLIDILPSDLPILASAVNNLLRTGGRWINFGSIAFQNKVEACNYSFEEVLDIVRGTGFEQPVVDRRRIPYMQSPASCHGRVELATTFAAQKINSVPRLNYQPLPDWLTNDQAPIPRSRQLEAAKATHAVLLDVVTLIDGQRTLAQIAEEFAPRYGLPVGEAAALIRNFLKRHYMD